MPRSNFKSRVVKVGDSFAVLLPQKSVDALGWKVGDELELDVLSRVLTIRTREEEKRRRREFEAATNEVFARHDGLLRRLAQSEREDKEREEARFGSETSDKT